ncbi:MAG TPA: hypothetical protein VM532_07595, partial [Burkholderiales bacterium]|nr:hypothetical protein [Burkholderiales bacterium]
LSVSSHDLLHTKNLTGSVAQGDCHYSRQQPSLDRISIGQRPCFNCQNRAPIRQLCRTAFSPVAA